MKRAAAVLDLTQPALTQAIKKLESEIGHKLLERSAWGVSTTAVGHSVYAHARQIRDEIEQVKRFAKADKERIEAGIVFGVLPSLSVSVVPNAIALWRAEQPVRSLHVVQKVQIELITTLLARGIDFFIGVTDLYDHSHGLKQRVLFREKLHVVASSKHPLSRRSDLSWAELSLFPWVTPSAGRHNSLLDNILRSEGISPPETQTYSSSISMLKSLVNSGDSLALLPMHAVVDEVNDGKVIEIPIDSPLLSRNVAVFMREGYRLKPAQTALVNFIQAVGLDMSRKLS